jgi:capsular exopolysaccharide synthesis family protein
LNVDNKNPKLAADIANRIAEVYVRRNLYYISKNEMLNLLKNEYLKLETKLAEYSKVYKDDHPEMIRLKQEMAELVEKIDREKKAALTYDIGAPGAIVDYKHALEGLKANNISVLSLAEIPVVPIRPKKLLNIAIAIAVGIIGGVALAFFFEYLDDTVKDIEDVERLSKWPLLGNVPRIDSGSRMTEVDRDMFVKNNPKDPIAEAYRSVRTGIYFSSTEEHPIKSVLITSPGQQEGKTTTLCNLGLVTAQSLKKVLLVDGDMRKPRLHEIFKKENRNGLSAYLSGQARFDDIIQKTDAENLFLVNGGAHPPNPSELLSSHKMAEFLKAAKERFDFVLVDSPPIAMLTDAAVLSRVCDGVIMVIETGKTSRKMLSRIYKSLNDAKTRIIGILLNKISLTARDRYYYSYYYGKAE